MVLCDEDAGRTMVIGLFATKEDLETGDATLRGMSPPDDRIGALVSVEMFEVAAEQRL